MCFFFLFPFFALAADYTSVSQCKRPAWMMKIQSKKILEPFCGDGTREGEQEEEAAGKTVYLWVFANAPHACPNVKNTVSP